MTPQIEKAVFRLPDSSWCEAELAGMELADGRLRRRAVESLQRLSQHPTASIPEACGEWSATKGVYGLFKHQTVNHQVLLAPPREQTIGRMLQHERVLAVQDTCYLNLSHFESMEGIGSIGTEKQGLRGLVMHTTVAITEQGVNLGVLHQQVWARPEREEKGDGGKKADPPIEEKESYKWLAALAQTPKLAQTEVVTVCDAEADVYELLALAVETEKNLLVRAGQDRALMPPEVGLIRRAVGAGEVCAQLTLNLSATEKEAARQATVSVYYKKVKLRPPQRPIRKDRAPLPPLVIWAVLVREMQPPPGATPVDWLLLTTVPIRSAQDALQRSAWYCLRWQIEIWHKILKSGCRIEHRRLKTADRLLSCLALYDMIAWRLHWLTHLARHDPAAPCTTALTPAEWQALYAHATGGTDLPAEPPSMAQVVLWVAQLGGFLARKGDGYPGVTVLWRGWRRLQDLVSMWTLFHPLPAMGKT